MTDNRKLRKKIHAVSLGIAAVLAVITTVTRVTENRRHIQAVRSEMKALKDGSCCRATTRPAAAENDSEPDRQR